MPKELETAFNEGNKEKFDQIIKDYMKYVIENFMQTYAIFQKQQNTFRTKSDNQHGTIHINTLREMLIFLIKWPKNYF